MIPMMDQGMTAPAHGGEFFDVREDDEMEANDDDTDANTTENSGSSDEDRTHERAFDNVYAELRERRPDQVLKSIAQKGMTGEDSSRLVLPSNRDNTRTSGSPLRRLRRGPAIGALTPDVSINLDPRNLIYECDRILIISYHEFLLVSARRRRNGLFVKVRISIEVCQHNI